MEKFTITLSDGSKLANLEMNGNNFISKSLVTEATFEDNLTNVLISDGTTEVEHTHMELVQIQEIDDKYYFVLRDLTETELEHIKDRADIEYIAMMTDVEL